MTGVRAEAASEVQRLKQEATAQEEKLQKMSAMLEASEKQAGQHRLDMQASADLKEEEMENVKDALKVTSLCPSRPLCLPLPNLPHSPFLPLPGRSQEHRFEQSLSQTVGLLLIILLRSCLDSVTIHPRICSRKLE